MSDVLALPFRLLFNLARLGLWLVGWLLLWPFVLLRCRQRHFPTLEIRGLYRLHTRHRWFQRRRGGDDYAAIDARLDRVAADRCAEGVLVRIGGSRLGLGDAFTLAERLRRLRRRGRRVTCHFQQAGPAEMVVAAAADTVFMTPAGQITLLGLKAEMTFAKDLLSRLGLRAQFLHIGRYKTAAHALTRSDSTESQAWMVEGLLDDLGAALVALIGERKAEVTPGTERDSAEGEETVSAPAEGDKTAEHVSGAWRAAPWLQPTYAARAARQAGLIDHQAYGDQVATRLRAEADGAPDFDPLATFGDSDVSRGIDERLRKLRTVWIQRGSNYDSLRPKPLRWSPLWAGRPRIAVVELSGLIVSSEDEPAPLPTGARIAPEPVIRLLERLRGRRSVKGVVLAIDSRGGSALGSDRIWREVRRLGDDKPVVAALGNVAASGGYYIAVGAAEIVATPVTLTGSIGIVAGKISLAEGFDRAGIRWETIARAPYATLFSGRHAFSAAEVEVLRGDLREAYKRFIHRVALGRGLGAEHVHRLGRGRVYTGAQARGVGLVDHLGGLDFAVDRVCELAGVDRAGAELRYDTPKPRGLRALLPDARSSSVASELLSRLEGLSQPGGAAIGEVLSLAGLARQGVALAYWGGRVEAG